GGDRPAVEVDEVVDDREAEAEPAVAAGDGGIGLGEAVEEPRQELRRDALARVAYGHDRRASVALAREHDAAPRRRELERVPDKVRKYLVQALPVPDDDGAVPDAQVELDPLRDRGRHELVGRLAEQSGEVDRRALELDASGDDARHVHDVVDELRLEPDAALDRVDRPRRLIGGELPAL